MAKSRVAQKSFRVQLRVLEVVDSTADSARIRVSLLDPAGALHFGSLYVVMDGSDPSGWSWQLVDDHAVQLPIEAVGRV